MSPKVCSSGRAEKSVMRPVRGQAGQRCLSGQGAPHRGGDGEVDALKGNRHGYRDWLIGLLIYRHGPRVSEACDLRWDDIDLSKRTIIVRRLKGSTDSSHYLEKDEHRALGDLWRTYAQKGIKSAYVFVNERNHPFGRMGIARMIERAGEAAKLRFPIHVHMLRHSTGYALAGRGMDTRRLRARHDRIHHSKKLSGIPLGRCTHTPKRRMPCPFSRRSILSRFVPSVPALAIAGSVAPAAAIEPKASPLHLGTVLSWYYSANSRPRLLN